MRRIIMGTSSSQVNEIIFQLGVPDDLGNRVMTNQATGAGYYGSSLVGSREDHRHPAYLLNTVANVNFLTSTGGVTETFARGDHVHYAAPGALPYGIYASNVSLATSTGGVVAQASRVDHKHYLIPATDIADVAWSAEDSGSATVVARGDHVHRILPGTRALVAGSRTTSQLYTNNSSGPMWIGISLSLSAPGADGAHLQIAGSDVAHADAGLGVHLFIMGIANPGETYLLTATGGANIEHWCEYTF